MHLKNLIKLLFIGGLIIFLTACFSPEKELYIEITSQELEKMIDDKESFSLYVYSNYCEPCKKSSEIVNEYAKENAISYYRISSDLHSSEEENSFFKRNNVDWVPSFLVVDKGEIEERFEGIVSISDLDSISF